mmetsp:Transcript_10769/g.44559  ORF Transcript_10769/g.44559 Transcript_10769/m.44559 type:complete len:210 (-) Transcript_10769:2539-3168(-)
MPVALGRHGILPRAREVPGHGIHLRLLQLLHHLAALLGQRAGSHRRALHAAVWVGHDADGAHLERLRCLAREECRLGLVELDLDLQVELGGVLHEAVRRVVRGELFHRKHSRRDELLRLPTLGGAHFLAALARRRCVAVGGLDLRACEATEPARALQTAARHRSFAAALRGRQQVLARLLVDVAHGQRDLALRHGDNLHPTVLSLAHNV